MYRYLQIVCTITHQNSTVHIVTHSAISKQQTYTTLITHYHNQQQLCTTFISTKENWKVILTAYCLQSADSQHSHCFCRPTNTLTAVRCTKSTIITSRSHELKCFVLLLYGTLHYQQTSALIKGGNWMFIILLLQCCKANSNTHCGTQWHCCYCCCHSLRLIYQ